MGNWQWHWVLLDFEEGGGGKIVFYANTFKLIYLFRWDGLLFVIHLPSPILHPNQTVLTWNGLLFQILFSCLFYHLHRPTIYNTAFQFLFVIWNDLLLLFMILLPSQYMWVENGILLLILLHGLLLSPKYSKNAPKLK